MNIDAYIKIDWSSLIRSELMIITVEENSLMENKFFIDYWLMNWPVVDLEDGETSVLWQLLLLFLWWVWMLWMHNKNIRLLFHCILFDLFILFSYVSCSITLNRNHYSHTRFAYIISFLNSQKWAPTQRICFTTEKVLGQLVPKQIHLTPSEMCSVICLTRRTWTGYRQTRP